MDINIQFIHCNPIQKVEEYAFKKVEKLNTFHDDIIKIQVHLKLEAGADHENKVADIKVDVPSNSYFAEERCHSFECAIDLAADTLKTVLKKAREKQRLH